MGRPIKSRFKPSNPKKYQGDPNNIILEVPGKESSATGVIRTITSSDGHQKSSAFLYLSPVDHRVHRYFPDYLIEVKEKGGKVKKYVVEVKPKKQTMPPKKRSRVTQSYINEVKTYEVNRSHGRQLRISV